MSKNRKRREHAPTDVAVADPDRRAGDGGADSFANRAAAACPEDIDLGGEYALWLDESCPVHSAVVAGIDIPKHVDLQEYSCPECDHRFTPRNDQRPLCPRCAEDGTQVVGAMNRQGLPRRARKVARLTDSQVRNLWRRLDPERPVQRNARGRMLDGPRMIADADGRDMPLAPFVHIERLDDSHDAVPEPEALDAAMQRRRRLRRLAEVAERLATDADLPAAERERLRKQVRELSASLGVAPMPGKDGRHE